MPGARVPTRSSLPGPLYGVAGWTGCSRRGSTWSTARTPVAGSTAVSVSPVTVTGMSRAQGRLRPADVVGVVHADAHLDEAAETSGDEAELTASLGAGEPAVLLGEPELPVVGAGLLQVGDREGDGTETVQCHGILLKR